MSVRAATGDYLTEGGSVGNNTWVSTITTNHRAAWTVHLPSAAPDTAVWYIRTDNAWQPRIVHVL